MVDEEKIQAFVNDLDEIIHKHLGHFQGHNLAAILLSRVTLLTENDPYVGKELLRYVWEQLDQLEQSNPGQFL